MALTSLDIADAGGIVRCRWRDGETARFHAIWLRFNAPDADTLSPTNGQRLIALQDIPRNTRIAAARIVDGDGEISFAPEDKTVRFAASWLRRNIYDRPLAPSPGWSGPEIETWDASLAASLRHHDLRLAESQPGARRALLSDVRRYGFAIIDGGPTDSGALIRIVDLFGYVRETNYGRWFDVRTELTPQNLAYTSLGLQAHTDNPYRDPVPTLQVLYCLHDAAHGGDSVVVDGFHAAQLLHERNPSAFELLAGHCARFRYAGGDGVDLTARRPMIELAPDGEIIAVRFNNRSTAPIIDVPFADMAAYFAAYREFGDIIADPALAVTFKLAPGSAFIVDNTRILHGRTAYAGGAGERWLQGCYADRDGLLSTLRSLEAAAGG